MTTCMPMTRPSDLQYRRIVILHEKLLPLISEIKCEVGEALAEAFFETCSPALREMIGVEPDLDDPGNDFWISPSDLLIGKVLLKPPFTSKYIKALTHAGILEIGKDIEKKYERQYQLEREKMVAETEELMSHIAEKQKNEAVKLAEQKEREFYGEVIEHLQEEFKITLARELDELEQKHKKELIIATEVGREQAKIELDNKLEIVVKELFRRLTEQFAKELLKQSKKLHEHFWYHLKQERRKLKEAVEFEKKKCTDNLAYLRHELQCENVSNVMYVLANIKRENECEKQAMEQMYLAQLGALEKELDERNEVIQRLLQETAQNHHKILARESLLFELIKQFQKFIYFALRAAPKQAEFLLDVEKLMIFEFTKTCFENTSELEESFEVMVSSVASSTSTKSIRSGSCLKLNSEEDLSDKSKVLNECDLPTVIFNENMYVREDFRNMLSQGLRISKSNELWNREIQKLTEDLVSNDVDPDSRFVAAEMSKPIGKTSKTTSVKFSLLHGHGITGSFDSNEKLLNALNYDTDLSRDNMKTQATLYETDTQASLVRKPISEESNEDIWELEKEYSCSMCPVCNSHDEEHKGAKVTNTIEDIIAHILEPVFQKDASARNSNFEKHRDSLTIIRDIARKKSSVTPFPLKQSKLVDAKDSLVLLKSRDSFKLRKSNQFDSLESCLFGTKRRNIGVQYENLEKNVRYSHIEIIPDDNMKKSVVTFFAKPELISEEILDKPISEERLLHAPATLERIGTRGRGEGFRIVGNREFRDDQYKSSEDFTLRRMTSLGRIFKKNPSLCKLFTQALTN